MIRLEEELLALGAEGVVVLGKEERIIDGRAQAQDEQFIPLNVYRTGAFAPNGIPLANGFRDYWTLINKRDGGINGVMISWEECEFGYGTAPGVECYERLKNTGGGASLINPFSTGVTYALIPKAGVDKIPIHSMGYGRTAAADGRVFPWTFNFPTTYWSQASTFIKYVGDQEGGMENLRGKKIALIYLNVAYGKEPIPVLEVLAEKYGYELVLIPIEWPGVEQTAAWLQMRRAKPDWAFLWGWGVSNQVAIKSATLINFPMDRFIGVWWSGSENDVKPSGMAAKGYLSGAFHQPGKNFQAHRDILKYLYDAGKAPHPDFKNRVGEVLYNRGLVAAMWGSEAVRTAMKIHGTKEITGSMMRDGYEALDVDEARLKELGLGGFTIPVKITCANHEGPGIVAVQQWDGKKWSIVSKFYEPDMAVIQPLIDEDSMKYAKENNITPRTC